MADALSALSLLLAAFTVLFGLWQPAASAALGITPKEQRPSRDDQIEVVWSALWRMQALLIVAIVASFIFANRAICIAATIDFQRPYDDLRAAFLVAELLLIGLLVLVAASVIQLRRFHRRLKSDEKILPGT